MQYSSECCIFWLANVAQQPFAGQNIQHLKMPLGKCCVLKVSNVLWVSTLKYNFLFPAFNASKHKNLKTFCTKFLDTLYKVTRALAVWQSEEHKMFPKIVFFHQKLRIEKKWVKPYTLLNIECAFEEPDIMSVGKMFVTEWMWTGPSRA